MDGESRYWLAALVALVALVIVYRLMPEFGREKRGFETFQMLCASRGWAYNNEYSKLLGTRWIRVRTGSASIPIRVTWSRGSENDSTTDFEAELKVARTFRAQLRSVRAKQQDDEDVQPVYPYFIFPREAASANSITTEDFDAWFGGTGARIRARSKTIQVVLDGLVQDEEVLAKTVEGFQALLDRLGTRNR